MKVAVVGYGSIGRRHLDNLLALGIEPRDVTVYDPETPLTLPAGVQSDGAPFVYGGSLAGKEKPDMALVCCPAKDHAFYVRVLLANRVPFFVEKPATLSVGDLPDECWQTEVRHLVGCNMLFRHEVETLRTVSRGGKWRVHLWCRQDMASWPGKDYGPPLFEFCHEIGIAQKFSRGMADAFSYCWHGSDAVCIEIRDGDIGTVSVRLGWGVGAGYSRGGSVEWGTEKYVYDWREQPADSNQMYIDEMAHLLDVVRWGSAAKHTLAQARDVVEVCERAWKSRPGSDEVQSASEVK